MQGLFLQDKVATRISKSELKYGAQPNSRNAVEDYLTKPPDDNRWWKKELATKETSGTINISDK